MKFFAAIVLALALGVVSLAQQPAGASSLRRHHGRVRAHHASWQQRNIVVAVEKWDQAYALLLDIYFTGEDLERWRNALDKAKADHKAQVRIQFGERAVYQERHAL